MDTVVPVDSERFRLRRYIEELGPELETRSDPIELSEIASVLEGNSNAVLFDQAGPERSALVGNVLGSRSRLAKAFGVPAAELRREVTRRLANKPDLRTVESADAPVHAVVHQGEEADLTRLPIHLQHELDGAPYISASVDYAVDETTGWTNSGFRRLMLRGRRETGVDLVSPSDLRAIYIARAAKGERLPITFVVGCHPIDQVSAALRLPLDELGLISSLRGAPMAVVRGVTNGVLVPADAEYTLEGYLDPSGHVEPEGPYGEFLGYYGEVKRNPVFHLTAITHRTDALFQTSTISGRTMSRTDTAQLAALRTEIMVWRSLESAVREPVAICATAGSGGMLNVRIAIRQRVPGEARNAIAAAFSSLANIKNVFVVDPDIDIFSDEQIDWALATRFQPDRDLVVGDAFRALPLDPSLGGKRAGGKAGFDLTLPLGMTGDLENRVPEPPRFEGAGGPSGSLREVLAGGPKFFAQLMTEMGSRDGREIIRQLEDLRTTTAIARDEAGRYSLAG